MNLTVKQIKVLQQVVKANGRDEKGNVVPADLDQLLERLDYQPTKESLQFTIRALVKHGLIYKGEPELRRDRRRVVFFPTDAGRTVVSGRPVVGILETENDDIYTKNDPFFAAEVSQN